MTEPVTPADGTAAGGVAWVMAPVLRALADQLLVAGAQFTGADLVRWVPQLDDRQRGNATSRMCGAGLLTHRRQAVPEYAEVYTVTAEGAAAIRAAGEGHQRRSGPRNGTRRPSAPRPEAFATRLWTLMRVRKMLDADTAAATLCDAGDGDYERRRNTARKYLRRWADAGAVQESARRIKDGKRSSNGVKRFVLVVDSPTPPEWSPEAKAKARAKARAAAAEAPLAAGGTP